ncbi:unnamed protein product [Pylaiella littoralis]
MKSLSQERAESIALTFTPNPVASQQDDNDRNTSSRSSSRKLLRTFGEDGMEEARLEPSVLGSIIPNLDPDPPDPARNNAFISSPSPTGAGSKRPVPPSSAADDASILGTPVSGKVEVGNSTGGSSGLTAAVGAGVTVGAARGGADEQVVRVAMVRKRKPRVKHGLRVLLRGTSRCGKSTILWDYCHRAAMAGHRVVLVCLKRNEGEDLASLPRSMHARGEGDELRGWEASALGRIGIKYVRSRDDLAWYLASLHTLQRKQWPTVIAGKRIVVDDVDKIVETSAAGGGGGGGGSGGGGVGWFGAAALRISALLQDTAEFLDSSRAEVRAIAAAAAATAYESSAGGTPVSVAASTPQQATDSGDTGGTATAGTPQPPGNLDEIGSQNGRGGGASTVALGEGGRVGVWQEEAAVRVVSTCSTSDRGMVSLYGRFVHAVARVQNTTGPDCFSLRVDPGISTAPYPFPSPRPPGPRGPHASTGFAPRFTPYGNDRPAGSGDGSGGGVAKVDVDFVRSPLDGSFALF